MRGHKKDVAECIQTPEAPVRGQETLAKAPRPGRQYRMEGCPCTGACIPGWRQAALPGSYCQAAWKVLTQTTKPQPAAAAVLPDSLTTLYPAKAGTPHQPAGHGKPHCCSTLQLPHLTPGLLPRCSAWRKTHSCGLKLALFPGVPQPCKCACLFSHLLQFAAG